MVGHCLHTQLPCLTCSFFSYVLLSLLNVYLTKSKLFHGSDQDVMYVFCNVAQNSNKKYAVVSYYTLKGSPNQTQLTRVHSYTHPLHSIKPSQSRFHGYQSLFQSLFVIFGSRCDAMRVPLLIYRGRPSDDCVTTVIRGGSHVPPNSFTSLH